jgi:anti-anti-sigma factor
MDATTKRLKFLISGVGSTQIAYISGFLTRECLESFNLLLKEIQTDPRTRIVLNLTALDDVDEIGSKALLNIINKVRDQGRDIRLCAARPSVREMLAQNDLLLGEIDPNLESALRRVSFQKASAR